MTKNPMPEIVSAEQWQQARDELLVAEKEATHALDAAAASRRRLPMAKFEIDYPLAGPDGPKTLLDMFGEHDQLVVYHFMDHGPEAYCPGCSWYTDNVPASAPSVLAERGIAYAHTSDMPIAQIEAYKARRGWTMPFYSSHGTSFAEDIGAGGGFLLNVFFRDGENVYRTYTTTSRGIDQLAFATKIHDLVPYGRQEEWEDSPEGWPQMPTAIDPNMIGVEQRSSGWGR